MATNIYQNIPTRIPSKIFVAFPLLFLPCVDAPLVFPFPCPDFLHGLLLSTHLTTFGLFNSDPNIVCEFLGVEFAEFVNIRVETNLN